MAQATLTVRTDANVKAQFTSLCEQFGMSVNTAMNVFMRAVMEARCIPFTIGVKSCDSSDDRLGELLKENMIERRRNKESEMTLEEINAEIAAYRAERKSRTGNTEI
ncbi:MAG: type II toxin-antitoxin system RelB/DinJ family antitoxin [Bacteroidaceae bacterium]|jgi:DNA-damage-inducible protein J|nr:type II toxin-antitoxin system RelB/DinJ family antitoxin [Bacteroidaceae bacterium]